MIALPQGYTLVSAPPVRAAIRADVIDDLRAWLLAEPLSRPADAENVDGGRGSAYRATLPGGRRAVVRPYRRGGILGRVVQAHYLDPTPRPFLELIATEAARDRGVIAPEVLGARVDGGVLYRGTLVTVELAGRVPLIVALRATRESGVRQRLAASAGRAVARLHREGVFHADLNLANLLVDPQAPDAEATVIDFDRARLTDAPLPARARRRNLERFERSRRKLDPDDAVSGGAVAAAFESAYRAALEPSCAS